jgi:hypothetical protein
MLWELSNISRMFGFIDEPEVNSSCSSAATGLMFSGDINVSSNKVAIIER